MSREIRVVDLFAGAGGASTGLLLGAERLGVNVKLTAINHWRAAVDTHEVNHPTAAHLCETIERVDPRDVVPGGHLQLLVAGPECIFFSSARGGKPINDQRRSSAWQIPRWCELLTIDEVLVENVPEFRNWGPLDSRGRPLASKRGTIYQAWLNSLRAMGYRIEERLINSADYGEATTRTRLFIRAVKGRRKIAWPEPTHGRRGGASLLRQVARWRGAREVIDWTIPSASIFTRKHPLSENTLRRIEEALRRFSGKPFVLQQQSGGVPRETDQPLPTVASDGAISLVEPFVLQVTHGGRVHDTTQPLPTITGGQRGDLALVEPFTMPYYQNGGQLARPVSDPMGTVTARDRFALVIPDGMDIRFRMLQPKELAAAMGFPTDYQFVGTKGDVIRMIGNAWSVRVAQALCECILDRWAARSANLKEGAA